MTGKIPRSDLVDLRLGQVRYIYIYIYMWRHICVYMNVQKALRPLKKLPLPNRHELAASGKHTVAG